MNILVTGGTGYIGSHTIVELQQQGHAVTIVDNLSNSDQTVIDNIAKITGMTPTLHTFDLEDTAALRELFSSNRFDAVIHFAGLKSVAESVADPLRYYRINLDSSLALLETMREFDVKKLIFSSSATVYGSAQAPCSEDQQTGIGITNPYGQTKYMIEQFMRDEATTRDDVSFIALRYFNPAGAHESGLLGELPNGMPNNLMPYLTQVASGKLQELKIFGDTYPTIDGTGVRDYVHVVDLAKGHLAALNTPATGFAAYNLGSGKGNSVLELVAAFERTTGKAIPRVITEPRAGDRAEYYADVTKAEHDLGWKAEKSIEDMCSDSWRWQQHIS